MRVTAEASAAAALARTHQVADAGGPLQLVIIDAHLGEEDGFDLAVQLRKYPRFAGAAIIMLTSASQRGYAPRCRELGLDAHLNKPVSPRELRQLICTVLDRQVTESHSVEPAAAGQRHAGAGCKILLAEDNPINQVVARQLLEKRGHRVTVTANGLETVTAVLREPFDLVLMDVQMPDMDGFEATVAIRKAESGTGRHLPIVAMTAHAMKGDQERCLEAGMDDYISKPIQPDRMMEVIARVTSPSSGPADPGISASGPSAQNAATPVAAQQTVG
jgi:CheY-like chemotaxis protein